MHVQNSENAVTTVVEKHAIQDLVITLLLKQLVDNEAAMATQLRHLINIWTIKDFQSYFRFTVVFFFVLVVFA